MQKSVVVVNDELGTIALGFSKAGYAVESIYVEYADKQNYTVCFENWGDLVKKYGDDDYIEELSGYSNIDCVAGRLKFIEDTNVIKKRQVHESNVTIDKILKIISENRPKSFIFQINKVNINILKKSIFYKNLQNQGYCIRIEEIDTRFVTGFPVNEKTNFIIGVLGAHSINLEILRNVDTLDYSLEEFCEKKTTIDEWYYRINNQYMPCFDSGNKEHFLCWSNNHYKKADFIRWNYIMVPLIFQDNTVRKITHREIARMKGIPDEYVLTIKDKSILYKKLMYCSNVQLIQQLALWVCSVEEKRIRRKETKGLQFEKIIFSCFEQKNMVNVLGKSKMNSYFDYIYRYKNETFCFDLKIYSNNRGVGDRVINVCKKLSQSDHVQGKNIILIVGNIVEKSVKEEIAAKYNVIVWDIPNILWILDDFPQLKSDFISLLSFSVSKEKPECPQKNIFVQKMESVLKIDLQEQLRKITPGKEKAYQYELLCGKIMKFLFSDNIEFYGSQKNSNDGLYRFDFCGKIKHGVTSEFFDTIQTFFNTKYVIFEFKNYTNEISQKEVYTTEKYLYEKALRKVAIIISRKGMDENAKKASRGSLRELGKLIICLSDEDINKLIHMKNNNEDPADYLEELLDEMLMDLEK